MSCVTPLVRSKREESMHTSRTNPKPLSLNEFTIGGEHAVQQENAGVYSTHGEKEVENHIKFK